jgi:lipopolysaccharide/colanic/teichoic acid biosynthesis glycosyltransferase
MSVVQGRPGREVVRRGLNFTAALFGLVAAAPVMLLVAVAIKLTSKGPIIYSQTRVGIDRRAPGRPPGNCRRDANMGGRPFVLYKFRTMAVQPKGEQVWASPDDPRITPVGRILRKYRLDELPQLVNVLKGDMNVVGPRPEQPEIFARMCAVIDDYQFRQRVLPGITGLAQISHHYDMSEEDVRRKLNFDLDYVVRRSPAADFQVMARTLPVMVFRKGGW